MNEVSDKVTRFLSREGIIPADETSHEIYRFGVAKVLSSSFITITVALVAILSGTIFETVFYAAGFMLFRKVQNVHLPKFYQCYSFSVLVHVAMVALTITQAQNTLMGITWLLNFSVLVIGLIRFIVNKKEKRDVKTILFTAACVVASTALSLLPVFRFTFAFTFGMFAIYALSQIRKG